MARTRRRALVTGRISGRAANIYAAILGLAGVTILAAFTNLLTVAVALTGYFFYVVMYSLWWKRGSVHGTVVGSVSGAVPPVVGYTAVTGQLDTAALLLFLILVFWQMPHFYAIAIFRIKDYTAAKVPVLPIKSGVRVTKYYIVAYITAFTIAASLLSVYGYTSLTYRVIALLLGIIWLVLGFRGFRATDDTAWARQLFRFSLLVLLLLSFTISIDTLLP
jgi:protoheme IX farnesyltransferase